MLEEFWISGFPAPYSTRREQVIPRSSSSTEEAGVDIEFYLPGTRASSQGPDLDNLCDPVFSILVNRLGWIRFRRPNIQWWRAYKRYEGKLGCSLRLWTGKAPEIGLGGIERSKLVCSKVLFLAQNKQMLTWVQSLRSTQDVGTCDQYYLILRFRDSSLNLGDIATGSVKYMIDWLAPILGIKSGKIEDWRATALQVEKGVNGVSKTGVEVSLWG